MGKVRVYMFFLAAICTVYSCKTEKKEEIRQPGSPIYTAKYNDSQAPAVVDLRKIDETQPLKLSQIGSEIAYYRVGDANFTVTQVISIPDSNAYLTFNFPRIYYRKAGTPSKRYGFKVLNYKWNDGINKQNLFYDKKTSRLFCALSGKDQNNKKNTEDSIPCIGELPPLDTMLTIKNYIFPEILEKKYPIQSGNNQLLGFSSSGYTLCQYKEGEGKPEGILTFNLQGDTLCQFQLKRNAAPTPDSLLKDTYRFQTTFWNEAQDQMTFMIPFCDTVFQLSDPQTITPLYTIQRDSAQIRTLIENPKALFVGLYQDGKRKIVNWLGWPYEYKPTLTHQAVYLKKENKTYILPHRGAGFVNDLDEGLPFWPDGQTDNSLYMIRTLTEMREMVKRTGSTRQKELINFLDDPDVKENDYVMIVVK